MSDFKPLENKERTTNIGTPFFLAEDIYSAVEWLKDEICEVMPKKKIKNEKEEVCIFAKKKGSDEECELFKLIGRAFRDVVEEDEE